MLSNLSLREVSFSAIDFETTGLSAKSGARVVEVAVVRVDPGAAPVASPIDAPLMPAGSLERARDRLRGYWHALIDALSDLRMALQQLGWAPGS